MYRNDKNKRKRNKKAHELRAFFCIIKREVHMRRKEKEITSEEELTQIIKNENVLRLGLSVDDKPYIVPLNYGYHNKIFYIHCAKEGKKLDMINQNSNVCFEIDTNHKLVVGDIACKYTMHYQSIIGFGNATILTQADEVIEGLDIIMKQFSDDKFTYSDSVLNRVAIIKITVDEMTGKEGK